MNLLPVVAVWCFDRRCGPGGTCSAPLVGVDVEEAIAVVDVVLLVVDAGGDELEVVLGLGGIEEVGFAGGVAGDFEEDVGAVGGAADVEVEALVGLPRRRRRGSRQSPCGGADYGAWSVRPRWWKKQAGESAAGERADADDAVRGSWPVMRLRMRSVYWRKPVLSVVKAR